MESEILSVSYHQLKVIFCQIIQDNSIEGYMLSVCCNEINWMIRQTIIT